MDDAPDPFAPLPHARATGGKPPAAARPAAAGGDGFAAILPAPSPLPATIRHRRLGEPARVWAYRDAAGALLFAVARFETKAGKEVMPYTFGTLAGREAWHWRAPPAPRPLFGLDALAARPGAPVLIVEGEKAAEAAAAIFADHVVTTSPSGARAASRADWSPLRGRSCTVWPDHDAEGADYAAEVVRLATVAAAQRVGVVAVPPAWPSKWDLADPLPPGVTVAHLREVLAQAASDPVPAPVLPPGFTMRPDGVFLRADDDDKPDLHVCGPLEVIAGTHDGEGEDWGALLRWRDDDGRAKEWAMPRALLAGDGAEVRARLLRGGLFVSTARRAREGLATYLMRSRPAARVRIVARLGWHDTPAGRVFVLPRETIGATAAEPVRLQTERHEVLPPVAAAGGLDEWKVHVAARCAGNSRLVLAVSAAFAAPLIGLIGAEGGGVHLRGASSKGKSAALVAAGSVWGGGGVRGWLQRWRATDNGLEALAAAHCDLLLTLDEMGEVDPRAVGAIAYMLANGSGKARAQRDGGGRRSAEWRVLFLSSGEVGIADKMAEAGGRVRAAAGMAVRVVDLPADAGAGRGLFEALHDAADARAFADRIKADAARCYGMAGPEFLRLIVTDPAAAADAVAGFRRGFLAAQVPSGADGQVARVADRFAIIAAGGELARVLGILPWPEGEAVRAAARCFADWRRARGGDGPAEFETGIAQVRAFLERNAEGRFRLLGKDDAGESATGAERVCLAGFRRAAQSGDGTEFFILPEVWKGEVAAGFDAGALAAEMVRRGFLRADPGDGKPACRCSLPGRPKGARAYHVLPGIFADG
jgi:uncharacterized protein (DUF927 family)